MKKLYFLATALFMTGAVIGQTNLQLETWSSGEPVDWNYDFGQGAEPGTQNFLTAYGEAATTTEVPDASSGSAARLETIDATSQTVIDAGFEQINGLLLGEWNYSDEPATFNFDIRIGVEPNDTAIVGVLFYNFAGDNIGGQNIAFVNADNTTSWTPISIPLDALTGTANKMVIQATSSNTDTPIAGSWIEVDNFEVVNSQTSSVSEFSKNDINLYPNPASDVINIETSQEAEAISITSMEGRVVYSSDINGTNTSIDVSSFDAGVYYYTITNKMGDKVRSSFVKK